MHTRIPGGLLITFEGPDKAGKSTQSKILAEELRLQGYQVLETREPGGTALGEVIRQMVMQSQKQFLSAESELLLFGASRAQLMAEVIEPQLEKGGIVICDRFADSTTAYQGEARRLDASFIKNMHEFTLKGRWPDLTLLLDLNVEISCQRQQAVLNEGGASDRFEKEDRLFHIAVREGFLKLAEQEGQRIRRIDASLELELVRAAVWKEVNDVLGRFS